MEGPPIGIARSILIDFSMSRIDGKCYLIFSPLCVCFSICASTRGTENDCARSHLYLLLIWCHAILAVAASSKGTVSLSTSYILFTERTIPLCRSSGRYDNIQRGRREAATQEFRTSCARCVVQRIHCCHVGRRAKMELSCLVVCKT